MPNSGPKPLPEETAVAPQNSNSVIIGKYELGVVLAAGDFDCRTRLCKHLVTGVTYVVRIYSKSILNEGDNVWMRRRIKESIAVQRVLPKHKNVVDMVECWETEENVYILMNLFHSDNVVRLFTNPKSFYYYGSPNRRGSEFGAAMGNNNNNNRTFSVTRRGTGSTRMDTMEDGNGRKSSAYEINHKVPRLSNFMHPEESIGTSQFQSRTNNNNNKAGVPDVSHIITLERIRDIFIKVVQGVLHLHHHSVAHTGIAPDHILIQLKADDKKNNNNNNSPTTSQKEKKEERFGQDDDEEEGEGKNLFNEANFLDQQVRISNLISCVYCPHPLNHRGHAQQTQAALLEEEEREAFYFAHCDDDLDRVGRHSSAQDPAYLLQRRRKKRLLMLNNKKGGNQLPEEKETSFNQDRQKSGLDEENFHKIKNELRGARSTVAPEILQQAEPYYDPFLADSWSLGVVFYFMLMRAKYPFDGANTLTHILYHHVRPMPTTRSTKSENDNFSNHQNIYNWMNHKNQLGGDSGKSGGKSGFIIPHVCVDLVSRLLQYSPTRRLTVEGILLHPFCFVADIWESESYFLRNANPVGNRDGFAAQLNMANNDRRGSMHGRAVRSFSQQRNSVVLQPSTSETIFSPAFPSDNNNNNNGSVENNMSNASSSNNNNNDSWGWDPLTDYISLRDHVSVNHPRGSSVYISKHPNNNNNNNNTMNNNGDEINVNNNSNWRRVSLFYNDPLVGVESKSATIIQRSFRIYRQRKVYYKINEMLNLASRIFFRRLYHNKELAEHKENNNKGEGDENGNNNTNENNKKETNDAGKGEGNISFDFSLEKENLLQFALKNKIISKYLYKQFYGNDTSTNGAVSNTENNNNNTTNNASQRRRSVRFNSSHSLNNNNNNNNNNNSMRRKPSITQKRLSFYQTKEKEANNNTNENENSVKEAENNT
ncbi:Protein kinase domain containing protein, putative [Angomonas deanei]|uniref:Protein kinase domain containing protein, putative n=1 Tax=Angomonas deanei TaxID=59799 RepID=A0A7G2CF43_9TRYP|nr:Protein kinase domain containing protein, putative [Angomonas deanei]